MRIAVPMTGKDVAASLGACEAFRFYEDDHGHVVRTTDVPMEETGFDAALALLERRGVDVLLCAEPAEEERRSLASSGVLLSTGASGGADEAVRAYLGQAIACDPSNTCNYCGFKDTCAIPHDAPRS